VATLRSASRRGSCCRLATHLFPLEKEGASAAR
jgi:hypothetical protein